MGIGWLTVLKSVPWVDVISNAPKVADGAKKLWSAVAKKPQADEPVEAGGQARLAAAEAAIADLHAQMLASSELIKALAEQNAQLIKRVDTHRRRLLWMAVALAVIAIAAVASLAAGLAR